MPWLQIDQSINSLIIHSLLIASVRGPSMLSHWSPQRPASHHTHTRLRACVRAQGSVSRDCLHVLGVCLCVLRLAKHAWCCLHYHTTQPEPVQYNRALASPSCSEWHTCTPRGHGHISKFSSFFFFFFWSGSHRHLFINIHKICLSSYLTSACCNKLTWTKPACR